LERANAPGGHDVLAAIPANHPCLPGHFPGRPIVPAVLVLDEVRAAVARTLPASAVEAIEHAKFQGIVLPDRPFRIRFTHIGEAAVDFACTDAADGRPLAAGRLVLDMSAAS
jgi:3-hydroxymyristoyl/3-hydroxydecanoyl-(acyl carrier protein) dehydratase